MSVLANTFLGNLKPPSDQTVPQVIERQKPTGGPANSGGIHLGSETDDEFKTAIPLIIESQIDNSIVELRGAVSNVSLGWSSNWQEETVYGRIDPIPTYTNTTRTVSITVQLINPAAKTEIQKLELSKVKLEKLNVLSNMCYPGYNIGNDASSFNTGVLKAAPLVKIKYGNVISGQLVGNLGEKGMTLGYIKSLNVDFQSDGLFAVGVTAVNTTEKYFQKISVSLEFGILHTHNVGYDSSGNSVVNQYGEDKRLTDDTIKYPFNFGK